MLRGVTDFGGLLPKATTEERERVVRGGVEQWDSSLALVADSAGLGGGGRGRRGLATDPGTDLLVNVAVAAAAAAARLWRARGRAPDRCA